MNTSGWEYSITINSPNLIIGTGAFKGITLNSSNSAAEIEVNCQEIGTEAFADITTLKTLTLGENIKTIKDLAFSECQGLTKIDYNIIRLTTKGSSLFFRCGISPNGYYSTFDPRHWESGAPHGLGNWIYLYSEYTGITVRMGAKVEYVPKYLFRAAENPFAYSTFPGEPACKERRQAPYIEKVILI